MLPSVKRKTKIIATLGPAVESYEAIRDLIVAGMNVARLNFSHGDHTTHEQFLNWVRRASEESEEPVAILQDIQGPRIRVGTFPGGRVHLAAGSDIILLPGEGEGTTHRVHVGHLDDAELSAGAQILMSDGLVSLEVIGRNGSEIKARVLEGGDLGDHKGVAFPGTPIGIPAVTEKDEIDLAFGASVGVDLVAASFVASGADIRRIRTLIPGTPVIAKIESAVGYANLDDILVEAHGAMVARGDLGVELSMESVPRAQKAILSRTNARARVSITATEMLESMTQSPRPTRAEVTDVSSAVLDGTDAVMLSAETAVGRYPIRAVEMMVRICREAEQSPDYGRGPEIHFLEDRARFASATAQACVDAAANLGLGAIVAFTESGSTARLISKYRPRADIFAYTPHERTYRRMALYAGVSPLPFHPVDSTDEMIQYAEQNLLAAGMVKPGDGVVMAAGIPPNQSASTNLMKLHSVGSSTVGVPGGD
jgi:pyruvate kinase